MPTPNAKEQPELDFEHHLPAGQQWFALWQLAGYWGISVDQLYRLAEAGEFETEKTSPVNFALNPKTTRATLRVPRAGVVAFMNRRRQQS